MNVFTRAVATPRTRAALPRLAAMFLTDGHQIPAEVLDALPPARAEEWECPLGDGQDLGRERAHDHIRIVPPGY